MIFNVGSVHKEALCNRNRRQALRRCKQPNKNGGV